MLQRCAKRASHDTSPDGAYVPVEYIRFRSMCTHLSLEVLAAAHRQNVGEYVHAHIHALAV